MLEAQEKLFLLLETLQSGSSWQEDPELYPSGEKGPQGSVNLSPMWFQQAHDMSTSTHTIYFSAAHSISEIIARMPRTLCKLQIACSIEVARFHPRIQCCFERNPGCNPPSAL